LRRISLDQKLTADNKSYRAIPKKMNFESILREPVMKRNLLCVVSLFLLSVAVVSAQQLATLNVTVTDASGSVVQGANVSVSNPDLGIARRQETDHAGLAVLTSLTAGDYRLTVNRNGFSAWNRQLTLTVGQTAAVPVRLGVASVQQSVTVSSTLGDGSSALAGCARRTAPRLDWMARITR
jgi:hypothetical protein